MIGERRQSGVLLHLTSLPGRFGCGDLGPGARAFVDWLARAEQGLWQMLPIHPTDTAGSPYLARSIAAGNPLLVSPEWLAREGLLADDELRGAELPATRRMPLRHTRQVRSRLLALAFERFRPDDAFAAWCETQGGWLEDYALWAALKGRHEGRPSYRWPLPERFREEEVLRTARAELEPECAFQRFVQYQFETQWQSLRGYAAERGVSLLGDLPIYVAGDSADVWTHPELFELSPKRRPARIAGTPPDAFAATGQLWGNPVYRWDAHAAEHFRWWIQRIEHERRRFDALRLDHFIGFARYWSVPARCRTATDGEYRDAPAEALFEALRAAAGDLPFIAEDLGDISDDVLELRDRLGLPGMMILQWAFGEDDSSPHHPSNHVEDSVVYTGTHDNDTSVGWLESLPEEMRTDVLEQTGSQSDASDFAWRFVEWALGSRAKTAILPFQDLLGLDTRSRMNTPGTVRGNWRWRLQAKELTDDLADRLAAATSEADRG